MLQDHMRLANDASERSVPGRHARPPEEAAPLFRFLFDSIMTIDPPEHTRPRAPIKSFFSLRAVEQLQSAIENFAENLLDQVKGAGRMDLSSRTSPSLSRSVSSRSCSPTAAPEVFADPERLDLACGDRQHLSFGQGVHHCVGGPLARIEAQGGIARPLRRLPKLAPTSDRVKWGDRIFIRGPQTLPVVF